MFGKKKTEDSRIEKKKIQNENERKKRSHRNDIYLSIYLSIYVSGRSKRYWYYITLYHLIHTWVIGNEIGTPIEFVRWGGHLDSL